MGTANDDVSVPLFLSSYAGPSLDLTKTLSFEAGNEG